jgi:hypothetical protein
LKIAALAAWTLQRPSPSVQHGATDAPTFHYASVQHGATDAPTFHHASFHALLIVPQYWQPGLGNYAALLPSHGAAGPGQPSAMTASCYI